MEDSTVSDIFYKLLRVQPDWLLNEILEMLNLMPQDTPIKHDTQIIISDSKEKKRIGQIMVTENKIVITRF
jgi:hypothetical protein